MKKEKHYSEKELISYVFGELKEENEIRVGKHLDKCRKCLQKARIINKFKVLWDNFNVKALKILNKEEKSKV